MNEYIYFLAIFFGKVDLHIYISTSQDDVNDDIEFL